ncbi:MAG: hydrolase, partial [Sphingomonadales bacterium]|nr:hydrolase [Sphingomonadales bacterium]
MGMFAASARAAESDLTLYADATVIDGTGAPAHPHQDILVRGERIVAIAPH